MFNQPTKKGKAALMRFVLLSMVLGGIGLGIFIGGCSGTNTTTPAIVPTAVQPSITPAESFTPGEVLASNEMRVTFMGTSVIPRIAQEQNSVFVELGNGDSFVFDCGSGVSSKYVAMKIPYSKMNKIFLTHIHGDHTSDLFDIYTFGPSTDRKTPLYVYGPTGDTDEYGTKAFCDNMKAMAKWHIESFSFLPTGLKTGVDGYDLIVKELPYMEESGIAYEENGVKITHFPAVHTKNGSISYKLEWNGLSMIFSGDTKPNYYMINQGKGVDLMVHEMVVPTDVWVQENSGLKPGDALYEQALASAQAIQDSSHTPEEAFGYIMSQTKPRLAVATHFQANESSLAQAAGNVRKWYDGDFTVAQDGLVINVSKTNIRQRMAVVSNYAWYTTGILYTSDQLAAPKYSSPTAQLNQTLLNNCIPESVYTK